MKLNVDALHFAGITSSDGGGRHPINLPEIAKDEHNPFDLATRLNSGQALIGWFCLVAFGEENDCFFLYRLENDLLCKYFLWLSPDEGIPVTELNYIWRMSPERIQKLFYDELEAFPHIFYDATQEIIARIKTHGHNVCYDEIDSFLETHSVFVMTPDRFINKK